MTHGKMEQRDTERIRIVPHDEFALGAAFSFISVF